MALACLLIVVGGGRAAHKWGVCGGELLESVGNKEQFPRVAAERERKIEFR